MAAVTRTLGSGDNALVTSSQGFGCMGITAFYGKPMADDAAVTLLKHAYDNGVTMWDTAEIYTAKAEDGSTIYNETVVGKGIAAVGGADKVQVATKFYPPPRLRPTMTPEIVCEALRDSCARLNVPCVDLYYLHRLQQGVAVEEQARAFLAAKQTGMCKFIGVSEFSADNIRKFHAICPLTAVQQEWSLATRDLEENGIVSTCRELGIGIVAYSPLCRALLSDTTPELGEGDFRSSGMAPRFSIENQEKNAAAVAAVRKMAAERKVTAAQLSLAWVSSQGEDVVPIPGTTKIAHLDDNLGARTIATLSLEERELVAAAMPAMQGERYASKDMSYHNQI